MKFIGLTDWVQDRGWWRVGRWVRLWRPWRLRNVGTWKVLTIMGHSPSSIWVPGPHGCPGLGHWQTASRPVPGCLGLGRPTLGLGHCDFCSRNHCPWGKCLLCSGLPHDSVHVSTGDNLRLEVHNTPRTTLHGFLKRHSYFLRTRYSCFCLVKRQNTS